MSEISITLKMLDFELKKWIGSFTIILAKVVEP